MNNQTTYLFWIFLCAAGFSTLSQARNDGFSGDFSRSGNWRSDSGISRAGAAPAARATPQSAAPVRSVPAPTYSPQSFRAPSLPSAPAYRSTSPAFGASATPPQTPAYSAPRVAADNTPRLQPYTPPSRQVQISQPQPAPSAASSRLPTFTPARQTALPQIPSAPSVVETPRLQSYERTLPAVQSSTPRLPAVSEGARSFGTTRSAPAVSSPAPSLPPLPERSFQGVSRAESAAPAESVRRTEPGRTLTPLTLPSVSRSPSSSSAPAAEPSTSLRPAGRNLSLPHDAASLRASLPRLNGGNSRADSGAGTTTASPMRFGTTGLRGTSARSEPLALPSALSLRSPHGGDTDRFGRTGTPQPSSASSPRAGLTRPSLPAGGPRIPDSFRRADNNALYRPPYGSADQSHQPSHLRRPAADDRYRSSGYHHDGHHDSGHHHDDHHDHHGHHPYWYGPYACSPMWWGPVVYPAGFGMTWYSGSFALSVATYAPACSYTRYYDSWCGGGWGYTGVYYGGWRSGWYGGFSYVYNPWPAYRTYYLYDPYPVTETVYVTQPAATTTVVYEQAPAATTYTTTSYAAAPAAAAYAAVPAAPAPAAAPAAYDSPSWDAAPAVQRSETAATTCFCPCRCNGARPCTCDYPCGSEYALRDEDFDLSLAFSSYAEAPTAEGVWSSYAGLDRWDINAGAYDKSAVATASGDAL